MCVSGPSRLENPAETTVGKSRQQFFQPAVLMPQFVTWHLAAAGGCVLENISLVSGLA